MPVFSSRAACLALALSLPLWSLPAQAKPGEALSQAQAQGICQRALGGKKLRYDRRV